MSLGVCLLSVIPCRAEPNDRAEIVTQLLFGEFYEIIEPQEKWVHIKIISDQYEAWICKKQHKKATDNDFSLLNAGEIQVVSGLQSFVDGEKGKQILPQGASIPKVNQDNKFHLAGHNFSFHGEYSSKTKDNVIDYALSFLNAPYLWGGKTIFGIDCSGFTQVVYKMCGVQIPRDAYQQAKLGEVIPFVSAAHPGDLAFFDNDEGKITHVGIILEGEQIIHASGSVRIDSLDHQGIFNREENKYTHKLRIVKGNIPL